VKSRACVSAILAALALTGCTVGPDWQQPKTEAPPAWRIDYAQAAELANAKWWEAFGDPVLNKLVEDALRENRDSRRPPPASTSSALRTTRRSSTRVRL
jgi:multidrug efflux system outer membrane protein